MFSKFKMLIVIASLFMGATSFAAGYDAKLPKDAIDAAMISAILAFDKTPQEAKDLLKQIVSGQEYDYRVSVISITADGALGKSAVSIAIGVDDLTDDDRGWGTVYSIDAEFQRNKAGDYYELKKVTIDLVAG